jgi:CRP/FNR family transcriptional regulator
MHPGVCSGSKNCLGTCPIRPAIAATGCREKALRVQRREFASGEHITLESDELSGLFIVVSGVVKIAEWTVDGDQIIQKFVFPGEFLKHNPWKEISSASAIALTDVKVCEIDYQWSTHDHPSTPGVDRVLLAAALRECRRAEMWQRILVSRKPVTRVVCFLFDVVARSAPFGFGDESIIELPMGHADIADFLGLKRETVCRKLAELREAKYISFPSRHTCVIRNLGALQDMVEGETGMCMQHSQEYLPSELTSQRLH